MGNVTVIGAQWGDEGKGKIVDWLASRADMVVRFQGCHNAGHTLVVGDHTYKLSTKALTGHSLGAASVHEAIYSLLMMRDGFVAGSANIVELDPRADGFPILRESREARLSAVMSNSFGFGGTNASLVFSPV